MFLFLVLCTLLAVIYLVFETVAIRKSYSAFAEFLQRELGDIKATQKLPVKPLSYGWFDDGFPSDPIDEENRRPLCNPEPHRGPDEYMTKHFVAEYKAISDAYQRKDYLRHLRNEGVWMTADLLDVIYADESEFVRAWAAGHLSMDFKDYSDWEHPVEIRNYQQQLSSDPSPLVRAACWSNPEYHGLPWWLSDVSPTWKEQFQGLTQLERLGLMRNPRLSSNYVVALLQTQSGELNLTDQEHIQVLTAAGQNPAVINDSRRTGREAWAVEGDAFPPSEEYGEMWRLVVDRWLKKAPVPMVFLKYIQTTPKVKLEIYDRLLRKEEAKNDFKWLRQEVIRSCDPFRDKDVLKIAWDDPDEECRKIAEERVGALTQYVGVKARKAS